MRRLHGTDRRAARGLVPYAGAGRPRPADSHHRGTGEGRRTASDAAGLYRPGCLPVRLLHARKIMSAIACVKEGHANSDEDIREYMSGNICRCAAYPNIVAAVKQAAPTISSEQKG